MLTVTDIATRLGVPAYRVDFYIRSRHIEPAAKVANVRLFPESIVLDVAAALAQRARAKTGGDRRT